MQHPVRLVVALTLVSSVVACTQKTANATDSGTAATAAASPTVDKKAAEAEIRGLDSAYFGGVGKKDANALTNTYSNDAISMPANAPAQHGHDEILKGNTEFLKLPNVAMTGGTDDIKFSDDGTMAYATGHYHATWNDAKGKQVAEDGKYLNVMQRVDGKWKIVADAYSGNAPPKM